MKYTPKIHIYGVQMLDCVQIGSSLTQPPFRPLGKWTWTSYCCEPHWQEEGPVASWTGVRKGLWRIVGKLRTLFGIANLYMMWSTSSGLIFTQSARECTSRTSPSFATWRKTVWQMESKNRGFSWCSFFPIRHQFSANPLSADLRDPH